MLTTGAASGSTAPWFGLAAPNPTPANRASRERTRRNSWPAALRVNVSPSTWPGWA
ncbi:hypothetical protein MOKP126_28140 [Mycobacterium avium subsp. hominissuis]